MRADRHHAEAAGFWAELRARRIPLASSFDVFAETLTLIRGRAGLGQAVEFGSAFLDSRILSREEVDAAAPRQARELFKQYRDKPLSFVDCTSVALLRRRGLRHVFAHDEDFRRLGFALNVLPD